MFEWLQRMFSRPAGAAPPSAAARPQAIPAIPAAPASPGSAAAAPPPNRHPDPLRVSFDQKDNVDSNYYGWLFGNLDAYDLDISAQESQVLDTLENLLQARQSNADLVRRLPGLIPQVLQSLRSENFSGAEIARKISSDVVLVAAVIRLANHAIKGSGTTIGSVEHAVIVIGQEGLRQLITAVAFRPIIDLQSGHFTRMLAPRIWDQSERCAQACRLFAQEHGIDPFAAFLAGLVQNVGLIVSLRMMDQAAAERPQLGSIMFCASLLRNARLLSCSISQEWHFPEAVTVAIREQLSMHKRAAMSPLGRLLSLSDYLSKICILLEQDRLDEQEAGLFQGLPEQARQYMRQLHSPDHPEQPAATGATP